MKWIQPTEKVKSFLNETFFFTIFEIWQIFLGGAIIEPKKSSKCTPKNRHRILRTRMTSIQTKSLKPTGKERLQFKVTPDEYLYIQIPKIQIEYFQNHHELLCNANFKYFVNFPMSFPIICHNFHLLHSFSLLFFLQLSFMDALK